MVLQAPCLRLFLQEFSSSGRSMQRLSFSGVRALWDVASMQALASAAPFLSDLSVDVPVASQTVSLLQALPQGLTSLQLSWHNPLGVLSCLSAKTQLRQLKLVLEPPASQPNNTAAGVGVLPQLLSSLPSLESLTIFDINSSCIQGTVL